MFGVLEELEAAIDKVAASEHALDVEQISRQHAEAIGAVHTPERAGAFADVEAELVTVARLAVPGKLRDVLRGLTDALDGDGGASSDDEIYAKRSLHSSKTMGGVRGDWFLDPEGGDIVKVALAAQMETASVPDDPRTLQQRRADALVDICRLSLASDHHPACAP